MKGATTITVTRNEILYAVNQGDKFVLAIVFAGPDDSTDGPHYLLYSFDSHLRAASTGDFRKHRNRNFA